VPDIEIPNPKIPTREKNRRVQKNTLELTLERLQKLYDDTSVPQGRLLRIAIKPRWITVLGSNSECGIATNLTGIPDSAHGGRTGNIKFLDLVGKTLLDIADRGIHATDVQERAIGIAALSALSQQFLGSSAIRQRGFLAKSWMPGDKLVQQYPVLTRLVTKKDIVAIVGYGDEVRNLRGRCRELHVTDMRPQEIFETVIIEKGVTYGPRDYIVHAEKENEKVLSVADVVIINASTLVNGMFEDLLKSAENARLVGLFGPCGSLIPDVFFERGIDFFTSFRIVDPVRFSDDMLNDHDMEYSLRTTQKQYMFMRPKATTRGTPIKKMLQ
jgi:uncharacterized protein (DUF4213/DUF364 family)